MDDKLKGLHNSHEILKNADVDDSIGMVKYSIDIDSIPDTEGKIDNGSESFKIPTNRRNSK